MRPIRTSLWFDGDAEEAAAFYCSIFPDAEVTDVARYTDAGPGEPGSVVTVTWRIGDRGFVGINGGPQYTFTPAISFVAECEDQAEVDHTLIQHPDAAAAMLMMVRIDLAEPRRAAAGG